MLVAIAACSAKHPAREDAAAPAVVAAPSDAGSGNSITFSVMKKRPPNTALGKRCTVAGEPLAGSCTGGPAGLALDAAGTLWVVSDKEVRRFTRQAGADCHYDPAGDPIALPPVATRAQPLEKGPVYMRSGGPAWHLLATADAIYAYDFLGGMFRIDRGKPEPVCDVFGYDSAAALGGKIFIARQGIEQLALGKKCTAKSAKLDDELRGTLHVIAGKLHAATRDNQLVRFEGAQATPFGNLAKLCSVWAAFGCGDGVCVVDGNCRKIVQIGDDGVLVRALDQDALFEPVPWSIPDAITRPDGTAVLLARNRDGNGPDATCEGALYELPPALFAR